MKPVILSLGALIAAVVLIMGLPQALNKLQGELIIQVPSNLISAEGLVLDKADTSSEMLIQVPKSLGLSPPEISAVASLVWDLDSDTVLFSKEVDKKVPIASTTKIMTALVATKYFKPNQILTVYDLSEAGGSSMGLKKGEQIMFRGLLYGLLLNSGNDAAFTIADNYPGGRASFIAAMNQEVFQMGLLSSKFDNPAGFDSPNHYSSASDLAKISVLALEDPYLVRIFATRETSVSSVDKSYTHHLTNLNKLLDLPGVIGIKTGTTPQAKENLVGLVEIKDRKILTIVLGSDNRFKETEKLLKWVEQNFSWN
ncbi:MAG: D-alanyl-D-alanine carboxypeptidase family protein [Candidatus Daviesbacteria bacterium]|nr:D-alanyl-D-alanine carboxypeptidase family protein [Candidatus Daviesbacteria bacterium]